ncbi:uncharacterized [Tachysurus ichikawai]
MQLYDHWVSMKDATNTGSSQFAKQRLYSEADLGRRAKKPCKGVKFLQSAEFMLPGCLRLAAHIKGSTLSLEKLRDPASGLPRPSHTRLRA